MTYAQKAHASRMLQLKYLCKAVRERRMLRFMIAIVMCASQAHAQTTADVVITGSALGQSEIASALGPQYTVSSLACHIPKPQ